MADLNQFCFTGRLTQDATFRTLASGKPILTANVAVNTGFGQYKKALFIKVQQWGDSGERIVQYLTKGKPVAASGELSKSEWTSKEGKQYVDFVVDVRSIQLLSTNSGSSENKPQQAEPEWPTDDEPQQTELEF